MSPVDVKREELLAAWEQAKAEKDAAEAVTAEKARAAATAELALLDHEGRGHTVRAGWIRAWLDGRYADCDRLLRLEYPDSATFERPATDAERKLLWAEAAQIDAGCAQ